MKNILFHTIIVINLMLKITEAQVGLTLPPPQAIPEEILRNEEIIEDMYGHKITLDQEDLEEE